MSSYLLHYPKILTKTSILFIFKYNAISTEFQKNSKDTPTISKENSPKNSQRIPKEFPKNSQRSPKNSRRILKEKNPQRIPKDFQNKSKRISKEFQKNSPRNFQRIPKILKISHMWIFQLPTSHLEAETNFGLVCYMPLIWQKIWRSDYLANQNSLFFTWQMFRSSYIFVFWFLVLWSL